MFSLEQTFLKFTKSLSFHTKFTIMGFKRRNWKNRDIRDNNYKQKGRARPKLTLIGVISLVAGILLVHYYGAPLAYSSKNLDNPYLAIGMVGIIAGVLMILFSLSKRNQTRVSKGMNAVGKAFEEKCQCCKCQNCGSNHNHWTHD